MGCSAKYSPKVHTIILIWIAITWANLDHVTYVVTLVDSNNIRFVVTTPNTSQIKVAVTWTNNNKSTNKCIIANRGTRNTTTNFEHNR